MRFYNLNSVDLATGRCAVEAVWSRSKQDMIDAFWASWQRLGCPRYQQVDNEMVFFGSPTHPRGMGHLIRFIRSVGLLNVFGEKFKMPKEAIYEYVHATIDVAEQTLSIYLEGKQIEEYKYQLR